MARKYGSNVVIFDEHDQTDNQKYLVVLSHNMKMRRLLKDLPAPTQVRPFEEAISRMVEANQAGAKP
jgi:hypothetical protein